MKELAIKKYVRYVFGIAIVAFMLNKFYLRPWALENELQGLLLIIAFSIPNLIEAIVGTLLLTGILFQIRQYFSEKLGKIKDIYIYLMAVFIATLYVVSQELKFHNLGGNNVYDLYDLLASILGLVLTFSMLQLFGFISETLKN